ncbi:MAG: hypothetical protein KF699_05205 [Phycisphaeraceae bacterium]|nr:hypothetical protein [Phycisphaeraceae bacterium]
MFTIAVTIAMLTLTQPDPNEAAQAGRAESPPPLSGPKVASPDRPKSLVEREFGGKLKRLDVDPAQAALALLELSREETAATERILNERAAIMDRIVTDNLREVVEMAQAFAANDTMGGLRLAADLYKKAEPFVSRGRLVDELAGVLGDENAAELRRLTLEYGRAAIEESAQENGPNGRPRGRMGAVMHERLTTLGHEVRQSFERTVVAQGREFEALLKDLGVTPEQESVIRAVIEETYIATFGKPTRPQQTAGFIRIYGVLDAEQRRELARRLGAAGNQPKAREKRGG